MAQRARPAARPTEPTVRVVFEPSRIAGECLAHAYAAAVPVVRRRVPAVDAPTPPGRAHTVAARQGRGVAR